MFASQAIWLKSNFLLIDRITFLVSNLELKRSIAEKCRKEGKKIIPSEKKKNKES